MLHIKRMLNPIICPECFQANEPARTMCWKCFKLLEIEPDVDDYVRFFGLKSTWRQDDLKLSFRKVARKYHPDVNPGNREAASYFKFANQAYEVLCKVDRSHPPVELEVPAPTIQEEVSAELYKKLLEVAEDMSAQQKAANEKQPWYRKVSQWFNRK